MLAEAMAPLPPQAETERRKASHSYVLMVQHLIERCLVLQLDQEQCIRALAKHASIQPAITEVVWKELEKENAEFFAAYTAQRSHGKKGRSCSTMPIQHVPSDCSSVWQCPEAVEMLRQQRQFHLQQLQQQAEQDLQAEGDGVVINQAASPTPAPRLARQPFSSPLQQAQQLEDRHLHGPSMWQASGRCYPAPLPHPYMEGWEMHVPCNLQQRHLDPELSSSGEAGSMALPEECDTGESPVPPT